MNLSNFKPLNIYKQKYLDRCSRYCHDIYYCYCEHDGMAAGCRLEVDQSLEGINQSFVCAFCFSA